MKPRIYLLVVFVLAALVASPGVFLDQGYAHAAPQKKKKKKQEGGKAVNSPPSVKLEAEPQVTAPPEKTVQPAAPAQAPAAVQAPTQVEAVPAEKDPQREMWRIPVEPYAVFGSGRPGKGAADFDKPDGIAFAIDGALLATDAKNHRVQVWDVKTKTRLGEFGHGILGGEIVDLAVSPNGTVLATDQTLNLAYAFVPPQPGAKDEKGKPLGPYDYQFKGTRFGEQGFDKLGGIAIDSRGRIYAVDAHLNEVRRFTPDGRVDSGWQFQKGPAGGAATYLHGCEGVAIDEGTGNLYVASEKDAVIQVFDWETGTYKGRMIGSKLDGSGRPAGKSIFNGSVEGLTLFGHYLLAVDESAGHIQVFDLSRPSVFNNDLVGLGQTVRTRGGGYMGFFGHSPQVDFEDKTNKALQQQVKDGAIIPGQANPPGYFCSPDSIASYTDRQGGETYIAVADQCNYRLVVYRWSDITRALGKPALAKAAVATKADSGTDTDAQAPAKGSAKGGKKGKNPGKKKG